MKELRIVFMGTPDFAVASLHALLEANFNIVAVITAADKPAGRGRKLKESAVKKYAISKGLEVLQPVNLKNPDFLEQLKSFKAHLQIVVAFRMLPKQVWKMPELGTFNLHASLLPDYRGAAPINWAVINGDTRTGVTTFFINEQIDTGAIIKQVTTEITENMTAGELHDILMELGSETVVETVKMIQKGIVKPIVQREGNYNEAPKLTKDNCKLNWTQTTKEVYNQIRGLNPYPGAWTTLMNDGQEIEIKVYHGKKITESHTLDPGTIVVSKKKLQVAVKNGLIEITDLKMAGKKRMDTLNLLNGYTFYEGCYMF